ncbi:MAG: 3-dehydroquinate synthase [Bacillota bacterium]|nr:3-dehydroquinate synthase [Bacillota bacterium]
MSGTPVTSTGGNARGDNVVLIGFMAAGKGSVARELAALLGRPWVDTDDLVAAAAGETIPHIFARRGEQGFRRYEAEAVRAAACARQTVIATGGGAVLDARNVRLLKESGRVVWLHAATDAILERTGAGTPAGADRPLLAGLSRGDAAGRVASLLAQREPAYAGAADMLVDTTGRTPRDMALEICRRLDLVPAGASGEITASVPALSVPVSAPASPAFPCTALPYPVVCGRGLLGDSRLLEQWLRPPAGRGGRCLLVTDPLVGSLYGGRVAGAAGQAGLELTVSYVPAGERAKRLRVVEGLYRAMLAAGLGRDGLVLALGGGAVGDTAGFAAASYMRGVAFAQIPTTLMAQVDSAVGGKTAVDLGSHKNTVGAFHQPTAVVADVDCLTSLPARELRSGLAEVLKYGLIRDAGLWADAVVWGSGRATGGGPAARGDAAALQSLVARCLGHKATVVAADERDTGPREALNFGHTLGHALEARAAGRLRHGEAVAWGMDFAVWLGERIGLTQSGTLRQLRDGLAAAGFAPPRVPGGAAEELLALMLKDKKARGGRLRLVLLRRLGQVYETAHDIGVAQAREALAGWLALAHQKEWGGERR